MPPPQFAVGLYSYQIGGSERIGANLAIGYRQRGYRVFCFAFYDSHGPVRQRLEKAGIECLDLNYLRSPRGVRRRITYQVNLARVLKSRHVSVLHVHHTTALILSGVPARLLRIPSILMTEHATHELEASWKYRTSARLYCRLAHNISVVQPGLLEYFRNAIHVPAERLHYIPNGVTTLPAQLNLAQRSEIRGRYGVTEQDFVFLFTGRLHHTKDLGTLLAATKIARQSRSFFLWLIGDGPERSDLEAAASRLDLVPTIRFFGEMPDVTNYLTAADAFVMSSITEGLPMALLEAMANHLPCIATSVGGIPDLFGADAGLLVRPRDPSGFAQSMVRLMDDYGLRSRISTRGFERVRGRFDFDEVLDRYLSVMKLPRAWIPPSGDSTESRL